MSKMEADSSDMHPTSFPNITDNFTLSSHDSARDNLYPGDLLDAAAVCFILFTVIGVSGNLISILALAKCPRLRNATTAFIINLCVADLIFCSFSSPLQAVTYIERAWNYGDGLLCKLFPFVSYANALVSLFTVVAITINRYVCIVHPARYAAFYRPRKVGAMIVTMWMSVLLLLSLPFFKVWGRMGYYTEGGGCDILLLNGKSPKKFIFFVALGLPSVVFIICYSRIYWVVRKVSRKVRLADAPSIPQALQETPSPHLGRVLDNSCQLTKIPKIRKDRKEFKVLKVTMVIFVTYVLCYFPVSFVKILRKEDDLPALNVIGFLLAYLANCVNPVIYVVISDEYRRAYADLFTCRKTNPLP